MLIDALSIPLQASISLSIIGFFATFLIIPHVCDLFISRGLVGKDMLKVKAPAVAESMGVIVGSVYFVLMFLFLPIPFLDWIMVGTTTYLNNDFPHDKFALMLGAILAMISMLFLGFADDVLDIRWRVKIWFPLIASMPLLIVYFVTYGRTDIVIPIPLRFLFNNSKLLHLGGVYYVYMALLCVFCTNAINIIAGANGVEGGQIVVITSALILNDAIQMKNNPARAETMELSLCFLIPFLGTISGYLFRNWYPAKCFGGDTLVYFSGMVFAVVGIIGNHSKTVLLFMIPQAFNFVFSCPQLFGIVPCPRHRMPTLSKSGNTIEYSTFPTTKVSRLGKMILIIFEYLRLVRITRTFSKQGSEWKHCSNLTLISLILVHFGPMKENILAWCIFSIQVISCIFGFFIRYALVHLIYNIE